ncbi:MAG TPA: amidase family protein [Acidimicrobiales bacterium]|nr:amidase family protein [Acidimicrobiales bacterium]
MASDTDLALLPAGRLADMIRRRELSSRELLELYLGRIDRLNPQLNAVVTLDAERAYREAAAADEQTARGGATGPLHGLPMTVKDAIEVAGMRSTGGSPALADHMPAADAPVVSRLRRAGAVVVGKTNVPEWSGDIQTYNDVFGVTNNPWDPTLTPGGSSGGPAASVAAGLTAFETGTDIGGSIRIPSSFCGICGHKPSFGVVSQRGYLDRVGGGVVDSDINVFGPLARSVDDLELLLEVMAGPDDEDAVAWQLTLPPPRHRDLTGYRVGLWLDDPACPVDREALTLLRQAADSLADAGARVEDARPPLALDRVAALFTSLLLAAVSVSLEPAVGEALAGNHRAWLQVSEERAGVRRVWSEWFRHYDVLLCPVMPMLPFPHDTDGTIADRYVVINGRSRPQSETLAWTGLVGMAYLPSTVVPVGRTPAGLPVGVQVVGPFLEDRSALHVAGRLAELRGGVIPPKIAT